MNVPTLFTIFRILLIPAIVLIYYLPFPYHHSIAAILFAIAAFTDWIDGYLARSLNQMTRFGAFLDPVADKLMVATALVIIVGGLRASYIAVPAAIIVGREIVISGLREWMAEIGKRTSVAVSRIGKVKTFTQMAALVLLLLYNPHYPVLWVKIFGVLLLYIAAVLTLWSMLMYLKAAWSDLTLPQKK